MNNSKTSLFLMELIVVILFFSLCGAVCVQLFMKTHTLDKGTLELSQATIIQQNLCECYLNYHGDLSAMKALYPQASYLSDYSSMTLELDADWNELDGTGNDNCSYLAIVSSDYTTFSLLQGETVHGKVEILRSEGSTVIMSQELSSYIQYEMEEH